MKIRTITLGLSLSLSDFIDNGNDNDNGNNNTCDDKIGIAMKALDVLKDSFTKLNYEPQTIRISINNIEQWCNIDDNNDNNNNDDDMLANVKVLVMILDKYNISFCSIPCFTTKSIRLIPTILSLSNRIHCSVQLIKDNTNSICPDMKLITLASQVCLEVLNTCGNLGNFRYCVSFNCPPNIPFFPASYHKTSTSSSEMPITIGLESGDLLFLSFYGADSIDEGRDNLENTMRQILSPIQAHAISACKELQHNNINVVYGGIDASINPGLTLPDSIGSGIENLLSILPPPSTPSSSSTISSRKFGNYGTLAVVSAITSAIKSLANDNDGMQLKLAGYSGLMLPVMEDLIMAERAEEQPPIYTIRDLLVFSTVCGVGLDTIPIPGNTDPNDVAAIYTETAAIAFRLNKPLSCRLLPMEGKIAGDYTDISSPYLCATRVFKI